MFKTIFSKLIAVFIAVLIFSFSVTGITMYIFLNNFFSQGKVQALVHNSEVISKSLDWYIQNSEQTGAWLVFQRILESYRENTGSLVWIVNSQGYIVALAPDVSGPFSDATITEKVLKKLEDDTGHLRLPDERQYRSVMLKSPSDYVKEIGDFYGLFKDTGISWLTIQKPYVYKYNNKEERLAIYLHTPIPKINEARSSVFKFFILSVVISVLVSIILIYIFSLRLTRPLKEINNAARIIAGGEFRNRVAISSRDEIGELASSFNQMVTALENLEEMRRGFIANVSHELRTPMTSIRGFIEGILDGTIPPEKHNIYLTIVREETDRLSKLVSDLLDLARMEAGEVSLNLRVFNINELMRRCIIKLESLIVKKDLEIEASFEQEEMFVNADRDAIERVVINLIHNAIKFTPEGGKIILSTSNQRDKVLVSVQDSGIGIDQDEINLIWDRFYKSDKSRSKDKTGTGLGLAIIKNIINEHKQEVWVESEIGKGAKFLFTLARVKENELQK